ncbi:hypothetical protein OOOCML_33960 (plasmid) [Cupriavidus necator H16]|uniref:Uncharacterized protein n=1 Tax=Cupriavidus necator (strain ATCC 17699 / DSM 428 / KCTC 22496 / NCIMB 10442 / H16 / Stanier 337) TaxID=381666 RepID=A0AAF1D5L3_CUPNH|nr:hypothetical protein [Cupriavidus necator]QCC05545.1 hypothetical protein E6A55_33855 [Cupriavidus necator H16]QQB81368.1 hypothetical protein I6H87_33795 [Cupriavidus necator]
MQHHDNEDREFPEPETVLAIRGAIATGRMGGPMGEPGHWLNEFWQVGAALRDHAEILQGVQGANRRAFLSTTADYLAASETTSEHAGDRN